MRTQWLLALSSTLMGIAVGVLFAAFQNVTFQVNHDWSEALIRTRRSVLESVNRPFGPSAESILAVALSAAKQQDKHVMVDIGSPPCLPCRILAEGRGMQLFQESMGFIF